MAPKQPQRPQTAGRHGRTKRPRHNERSRLPQQDGGMALAANDEQYDFMKNRRDSSTQLGSRTPAPIHMSRMSEGLEGDLNDISSRQFQKGKNIKPKGKGGKRGARRGAAATEDPLNVARRRQQQEQPRGGRGGGGGRQQQQQHPRGGGGGRGRAQHAKSTQAARAADKRAAGGSYHNAQDLSMEEDEMDVDRVHREQQGNDPLGRVPRKKSFERRPEQLPEPMKTTYENSKSRGNSNKTHRPDDSWADDQLGETTPPSAGTSSARSSASDKVINLCDGDDDDDATVTDEEDTTPPRGGRGAAAQKKPAPTRQTRSMDHSAVFDASQKVGDSGRQGQEQDNVDDKDDASTASNGFMPKWMPSFLSGKKASSHTPSRTALPLAQQLEKTASSAFQLGQIKVGNVRGSANQKAAAIQGSRAKNKKFPASESLFSSLPMEDSKQQTHRDKRQRQGPPEVVDLDSAEEKKARSVQSRPKVAGRKKAPTAIVPGDTLRNSFPPSDDHHKNQATSSRATKRKRHVELDTDEEDEEPSPTRRGVASGKSNGIDPTRFHGRRSNSDDENNKRTQQPPTRVNGKGPKTITTKRKSTKDVTCSWWENPNNPAAGLRRSTRAASQNNARQQTIKEHLNGFRNHGSIYSQDEEAPRRRTRSSERKKKTRDTAEVIDLAGDDDSSCSSTKSTSRTDQENQVNMTKSSGPERTECDAVRIAIGQKVFWADCRVAFSQTDGKLILSYFKINTARTTRSHSYSPGESVEHIIDLPTDLKEMKFFVVEDSSEEMDDAKANDNNAESDADEQMSFLCLRIEPTVSNDLKTYSKSYKPDDKNPRKRYVVIEFRSDKEFLELLGAMKKNVNIEPYTHGALLNSESVEEYSKSLVDESKKDSRQRHQSMGSPTHAKKPKWLVGRKDDEVLVAYPFDGDKELIEKAAEGLKEASRTVADETIDGDQKLPASADAATKSTNEAPQKLEKGESDGKVESETEATISRAHYLTIRAEDCERLFNTEEFLNDTLVDFWMQWIQRNSSKDTANVHIFSSHFYSTLESDGPKGVTKWTKRKGIDIFTKKFIFIPINKNLHWSQCVVVNPAAIAKHTEWRELKFDESQKAFSQDDPVPCILFFDSLKAHRKAQVAKTVRKWLNSEWRRLDKTSDSLREDPFGSKNDLMKVFSPKIPYQNNSWDCGVFVCRYAHAMYMLRNTDFSYKATNYFDEKKEFADLITNGPEFDFGMTDIYRIREEMLKLIENLSLLYIPWKQKFDRKAKEEKIAARKALADQGKANGATETGPALLEGPSEEKADASEGPDPGAQVEVDSKKEEEVQNDSMKRAQLESKVSAVESSGLVESKVSTVESSSNAPDDAKDSDNSKQASAPPPDVETELDSMKDEQDKDVPTESFKKLGLESKVSAVEASSKAQDSVSMNDDNNSKQPSTPVAGKERTAVDQNQKEVEVMDVEEEEEEGLATQPLDMVPIAQPANVAKAIAPVVPLSSAPRELLPISTRAHSATTVDSSAGTLSGELV